MGKNYWCRDDEGFRICSVEGEGQRCEMVLESVTPEAVPDFVNLLPTGTSVELASDVISEDSDRGEAVFSHLLPPLWARRRAVLPVAKACPCSTEFTRHPHSVCKSNRCQGVPTEYLNPVDHDRLQVSRFWD